jgi:ribosome-binding protein aMBF1 (putative translation factor)
MTPVLAGVDISKLKTRLEQIEARHGGKTAPPKRPRTKPAVKRAAKPARPKPPKQAPSRDPVAAAILRARTAASLTQTQLAERLKTDQGNIARLERGRTQAAIRTLQRVAAATGRPTRGFSISSARCACGARGEASFAVRLQGRN